MNGIMKSLQILCFLISLLQGQSFQQEFQPVSIQLQAINNGQTNQIVFQAEQNRSIELYNLTHSEQQQQSQQFDRIQYLLTLKEDQQHVDQYFSTDKFFEKYRSQNQSQQHQQQNQSEQQMVNQFNGQYIEHERQQTVEQIQIQQVQYEEISQKRKVVVFGDNYQESTDENFPNLVPIINYTFHNEYMDLSLVSQPHDVWMNYLNGTQKVDGNDNLVELIVYDQGVPFSTARQSTGDCQAITEILDIKEEECRKLFTGIQHQILSYITQQQLSQQAHQISDETHLIVTGTIDIINAQPEEVFFDILPQQIADSIKEAVRLLLEAGSESIKIANLPPLYLTPFAISRAENKEEKVKEMVFRVNHEIARMLREDFGDFEAVELIDFHGIVVGAIWEADESGYDVNVQLQFSQKEPIQEFDGIPFWVDTIHPVQYGHELIAEKLSWFLFD